MKYKAVIFDMDGTLLDTLEDLRDSVNFALGQCPYPLRATDEIRQFVGNGVERLIALSVPEGASDDDRARCLAVFKERYAAHSRVKTHAYDGIPELLTALKANGIKVGVVSNKLHAAVDGLCQDFFMDLVDYAVGEREGVPKKPAPDCVYDCMAHLGENSVETLFVGDSDIDILTAKNAGLDSVGVLWGFRDEALLRAAGAGFIVKHPKEILAIIGGEPV